MPTTRTPSRLPHLLAFLALAGLILGLAPPATAQAPAGAPVAMVASVKGPVRKLVLPAGGGTLKQATASRLVSLDALSAGIFLQVGTGGQATLVYHSDGHREDLTGPCIVRVAAGGSHLIKGAASAIHLTESELGEAVSPAPVVRAQPVSGTRITARNTDGVPTFSWTTSATGPVMAVVYEPGPPRVNVWSSEQTATSAMYDGPVLVPDTPYIFQIEQSGQALGAVRFQVNSPGALASLQAAQGEVQQIGKYSSELALLAVAQDQNGNLPDAVTSMQGAINQQPDDSGFVRRMSAMVREMGDEAQANALENRAKYLEDSFGGWSDADVAGMDLYMEGLDDPYWY